MTTLLNTNAHSLLTLAKGSLIEAEHHLFNGLVWAAHLDESFYAKCSSARVALEEVLLLIEEGIKFYVEAGD